jgi:ABC-type antimicrobial peptide transport system permease subunit
MVLTLMGIACGIPLGIWLHRYVMANIRIDMVSYDVKILPMSFVIAVALTIVFAIIVDFVMYFRLDRINMAESLKSVE